MNAKILFLTIFLFPHISLTGQTSLEIWEIQGSDLYSDYQGQTVATNENIVVSIGLDRFFMQTPTVRSDDNPMTSDGILVYTGSTPQVEVGDLVSFNATVQEFNNVTQLSAGGVSINILANNQALPSMATLDENFPSSTIQEVPDLEHVESMLVMVANGTICGPTSYNGLGYATAGSSRSFREAGVESPGIFGLPVFDGNPELFRIDTEDFISSRARFFASGIIYQDDDEYVLKADVLNILSEDPEVSVREKNPEEFTIGSLNCLGLDNTEEDFVTRSRKLSKYITDLMRSPDVIAVQEVRDLATLEALAVRMHLENPSILYDAYLEEGNSFGDFVINNGYLVNSIYQDIAITQLGKDIFFQFGGFLHDRPPLQLEITLPNNEVLNVLNLHLRSLGGIEGSNANFVRTKRHQAAISVAEMVQDIQNENLVVVGDFNAFQFSDGYVDVVNQISGQESLGAQFETEAIVNPPLINMIESVEAEERYSYVFNGNAQVLDHCLVNSFVNLIPQDLQYCRGNSDHSQIQYFFDISTLRHSSDHDGFVLFIEMEQLESTENLLEDFATLRFSNPMGIADEFELELDQMEDINVALFNVNGQKIAEQFLKDVQSNTFSFSDNNLSGLYFIKVSSEQFELIEKVVYK